MESIDDERNDTPNFPIPASKRPKLTGIDFYKYTLGAPKYVVCKYTLIHYLFTYFTIILCTWKSCHRSLHLALIVLLIFYH